ncbi:hypothetical protein CHARACLAT_027673, partial [Characodon lateralis]|nr:hypothetical protein [Characodon lateralis]
MQNNYKSFCKPLCSLNTEHKFSLFLSFLRLVLLLCVFVFFHLAPPPPPQVGLCLGSKVDSLALPGSSITEASLLTLLPCLTSLRRLDVRGLDSLFMSGAFLSREEHRRQ